MFLDENKKPIAKTSPDHIKVKADVLLHWPKDPPATEDKMIKMPTQKQLVEYLIGQGLKPHGKDSNDPAQRGDTLMMGKTKVNLAKRGGAAPETLLLKDKEYTLKLVDDTGECSIIPANLIHF